MPYASVIIPTHDRAATLATAVQSVQRQSIHDIEILIVGDGPTSEVSHIARSIAAEDPRVRFLEFPKAPGSGGENRDRAIREHASSERIFYNDDDDLWLPQHIGTIGPHLDRHHVVDTLPVSARLCGQLVLTLVNSGSPQTRKLLVEDKLKLMFDTHLAHRKSTYLAFGAPWCLSDNGTAVRRLLGTFAGAKEVAWCTLPTATAISFHGGARAACTPSQRRDELVEWTATLADLTPEILTGRASPVWNLFYCLRLFKPEPNDGLDDYLRRLGMRTSFNQASRTGLMTLPIGPESYRDLETSFALYLGKQVEPSRIKSVASLLLDTVKMPVASWAFLRQALRMLPFGRARELVRSISPANARAAELFAIYDVYMLLWSRRVDQALEVANELVGEIALVPHEAELALGEVLIASGQVDDGIEYLRRAAERTSWGSSIAVRLANALMNAGKLQDAEACIESMETRLAGLPTLITLRERLSDLRS